MDVGCFLIVRLICVNIYERIVAVRIIIRIDINDIYFENNSLYIRCLHKEESVCKIIFIKHLAHSKNTFYLCTIKRTIFEHSKNKNLSSYIPTY